MGIFDGLFGSSDQTVTTKTQLPPWLNQLGQSQAQAQGGLMDLAADIYQQSSPYQAYGGQRLQGFTPDQMTAFGMTRENAGLGSLPPVWQQGMEGAYNAAGQGTQGYGQNFAPGQIQTQGWTEGASNQYMDPYREQVLDRTISRMDDQNQRNRLQTQARFGTSGGGSRHGIADLLRESEHERSVGDVSANTLAQGYESGRSQFNQDQGQSYQTQAANQNLGLAAFDANRGQFNQDAGRQLQGAGLYAGLGSQEQQMGNIDSSNLLGIGALQQQQGQQSMDIGYQDYQRQQQQPWEQFGLLQAGLSGNQVNPQLFASTTQTQPGPSAFGQIAGIGLGIAGLGGKYGNWFGGAAT